MKKAIIFGLFLFFGLYKSYAQFQPLQSSHSVIRFTEDTFNFGVMPYGADVSHKFGFQNISKEKICIREVKTSCGCTTPDYSTDPVKPRRKGFITAKYDSKRPGKFTKTMTVLVSDGEEVVLTIKGDIQAPEKVALPR